MNKQELAKINENMKMIATHCVFRGNYTPLSNGFFTNEGKIDDRGLSVLAADYLVLKKKIGFRIAYRIVSRLSNYMKEENKMFYELTLDEYNKFSKDKLFDEDIFDIMRIPVSVKVCAGEMSLEELFKR
jgi:hypothetical protein